MDKKKAPSVIKRVNLEITDALMREIDRARGDVPRNRWIRRSIEMALSNPAQLRQHITDEARRRAR